MKNKLSIIIPFYNETTINQIIDNILEVKFEESLAIEIIIVDDGSDEKYSGLLKKAVHKSSLITLLKHQGNKGKGAAIKTALPLCSGNLIIIQDADLEYFPSDIPNVIKPIIDGETLVSYGSRHLGEEQRRENIIWFKKHFKQTIMAYIGGRILTLLCNLLFWKNLTDVATCYKAFRADFLKSIYLSNNGFNMEAELTVKTLKKTNIIEIPIKYNPRTKKEGKKIRWTDGFQSIFAIFGARFSN